MTRQTAARAVVIVLCLVAIVVIGRDLATARRAHVTAARMASAIQTGEIQRRAERARNAEDDALWDDAAQAGEDWAASHPDAQQGDCPDYGGGFHKACEAALSSGRAN